MQPSPLLPLQAPFFALDLAGKAQQGNLTTCTFHDSPTHKASSMTPDSPPCLPALALRLVPLVPQIEPAQPCFDLHAGAPFPRPPANKLCKTEYCGKFNFNSLYPCDSELLCVCVCLCLAPLAWHAQWLPPEQQQLLPGLQQLLPAPPLPRQSPAPKFVDFIYRTSTTA